jgi:hypothetical protein
MSEANALMMAMMEPPASMEDEFNDWYDYEHLPERNAVPGFVAGHRWRCLHGHPKWLATYFLSHAGVLHEPAYVKVGYDNASPWTKRVTSRTIGRLRVVGERIGAAPRTAFDPAVTGRLLAARYPVADAAAETRVLVALEEAAASMEEKPDLRIFRGVEASNGNVWVLAGFSGAISMGRLTRHFGYVAGIGAAHFNLYMPHWKVEG